MSTYRSDIDAADLMAYLDGVADAATVDRLRTCLGGDRQLAEETAALGRMEALLSETGSAQRASTPPVDLLSGIMKAVNLGAVPADDPEDGIVPAFVPAALNAALLDTAAAVRALPEVNLLDGVMRGLAHMKAREEETGVPATDEDAELAAFASRVEAVGAEIREKTPQVDIVEPVMVEVSKAGQNVIPFRSRPRVREDVRRGSATTLWVFRVAAVLVMTVALAGGWVIYHADDGAANLAGISGSGSTSGKHGRLALFTDSAKKHSPKNEALFQKYSEHVAPAPPIAISVDMKSDLASLTMDKVLGAKREALGRKEGAAEKLSGWANLTADEARRLLEEGGLSDSAMLGAIQALPAEEAANYLRAAVEKSPDDPYLRYMLARNLMSNPETRPEAAMQIAAMKELAGDNALPYYMDASAKLSGGDINGALLAMDLGAGLETASPYGLETARNRSAALEAAGMASEVARFLAASNAGQAEYNELMGLGQELMEYGQQYEDMKDYETAGSIYDAVQALGTQVQQGATLTNERLAGFDLQMSALDAVARLADVLKTPEGLQFIEGTYNVLAGSLSTFMDYLVGVGSLFGSVDAGQAGELGRQILTGGDLNLPVGTPQQ